VLLSVEAFALRCVQVLCRSATRQGVSESVSMLEKWQCSQHRMRTVRRRNYAGHLTVYRGILEHLEQVEIDPFPTAFVT
jgi:hypothetical protein